MSNDTNDTNVPETMKIDNVAYITLADYARLHERNGDRLRGMARDGKCPTAKQLFGSTWVIARDAVVPVSAPRAAARPDGRKPYTLYATADEIAMVRELLPTDNVIDPRAVSRAKRAAAKTGERNTNAPTVVVTEHARAQLENAANAE